MYLMARLLSLCSCNLVCRGLFSLLCVVVWKQWQEVPERRSEFYWRSPRQVCFCVIMSVLKSPSCWSSGIHGISVEIWYRLDSGTQMMSVFGGKGMSVCCSVAASMREKPESSENDRFVHICSDVKHAGNIKGSVHTNYKNILTFILCCLIMQILQRGSIIGLTLNRFKYWNGHCLPIKSFTT